MNATPVCRVTAAVLAKWPRPGHVKTRLCPPLHPVEASDLAAAALADTMAAVTNARVTRRVAVLDEPPDRWAPTGFSVLRKRGTGLDERLAAAFADLGGPTVLVGMDTPQIDGASIEAAGTALVSESVDAVLGLAADGGFWLVGLREPSDDVFLGVPMSRPDTGQVQLDRLRRTGRRVALLEVRRDVDTVDDARAVAVAAPWSRFARTLASFTARDAARHTLGVALERTRASA